MSEQLECRVIVTHGHRTDLRTEVGMYCPVTRRYETLGTHGPALREVDHFVRGLARRIEAEGHRLTYSVVRGPR